MKNMIDTSANEPVAYRDGHFIIDGDPHFVIAAEYQYYRDRRESWSRTLHLIRAAGTNTVTFYVPWRHHQVANDPQQFDFSGTTAANRDVRGFIATVADTGMHAIVKPGPFVHSELNIGGLPDAASPSYTSRISPALNYRGRAVRWEYDGAILPAPFDSEYIRMAATWLNAVGSLLRPFVYPSGPVIGVQINDETLYCTSNSPPWTLGYEESSIAEYRRATGVVLGQIPRIVPIATGARDAAASLIRWSDYQWWLRRETYRRYREMLGVDLPHLSNHAGITPPIEENVPQRTHGVPLRETQRTRTRPAKRYADWWLHMNRLERDDEIYHYGFISWLGVAAYNIDDPSTIDTSRSTVPNDVFNRYVNTAARCRGINLEENWGFAKLYHPFSAAPFVPFFQTLLSIAAGGTGYTVFCAVQHDYWDDDLDSMTKLQHSTFPSDAPIRADGTTTSMYAAMKDINRWFGAEGKGLLAAGRISDIAFAVPAPYAAVMSWARDGSGIDGIRAGGSEMERLSCAAQEAGYIPRLIGLEGRDDLAAIAPEPLVVVAGERISAPLHRALQNYLDAGGVLLYGGNRPRRTWDGESLSPLAADGDRLIDIPSAHIERPSAFPAFLAARRITPGVPSAPGIRFFRYAGEDEEFIFFFKFSATPTNVHFNVAGTVIAFEGPGRCAGALAVHGGRLRSALFKGVNEVENTQAAVMVAVNGNERHRFEGDVVAT